MAWFANHYKCDRCGQEWTDEWSCMCDDDCPHCGFRHMTPYDSDDLTELIEEEDGQYVVFRSPATAEHSPDYQASDDFRSAQVLTPSWPKPSFPNLGFPRGTARQSAAKGEDSQPSKETTWPITSCSARSGSARIAAITAFPARRCWRRTKT